MRLMYVLKIITDAVQKQSLVKQTVQNELHNKRFIIRDLLLENLQNRPFIEYLFVRDTF